MMWRGLSPLLLSLAVLLLPVGAGAKLCGDDVGGHDVPCACGDIVASDLVLNDDPVTQAPCAGDGLTVRATGAAAAVTIDLRGKTLRGNGHGTGIWLLYGGPGGARVISTGGPATVAGFQDGVVAHGDDSVALIDGVVANANRRDGMRLTAVGYEVRNAEARGSGRDGFSFLGKGYRARATRATDSHRYGYDVAGRDGVLGDPGAGLVAEGSGTAGFWVTATGLDILDCVASGGVKDGLHLMGVRFDIRGCTASGNGGSGITGYGMVWQLAGNRATANAVNGIAVEGMWVVDAGGNSGSGNRGDGLHVPVVQCAVGGQACQP
jgi:hypothetical protein